jgi:hypothetical protein
MKTITYYVALPFTRDEHGRMSAGVPCECPSASSAIHTARRLASTGSGAGAFDYC